MFRATINSINGVSVSISYQTGTTPEIRNFEIHNDWYWYALPTITFSYPDNEIKFIVNEGALDKIVISTNWKKSYPADALSYNLDTDGDGIPDCEEVQRFGSNPSNDNTDGDSIKDGDDWFTPPEWESKDELILAWSTSASLEGFLTSIIKAAVDTVKVKISVDKNYPAIKNDAITKLTNAGIPLTNIVFHEVDTPDYSTWMRDYGPIFVMNTDNNIGVFDWQYQSGSGGDHYPLAYATDYGYRYLGEGSQGLYLDGGRFQTDGTYAYADTLFSSDEKSEIEAKYGLRDVRTVVTDPLLYHLDLYVYITSPNTVIVADSILDSGEHQDIAADNAAIQFEQWGFTVYRVKSPHLGVTLPTYANALVINDIVLVPQYYHDGGTNEVTKDMDNDAKAIFQLAFPGKTIIGIDAYYAILNAGAIHCVAVTLPRVPWT